MDAYRAQLQFFDPDITDAVSGEERRQAEGVEMILLAALGSVLTNKYFEGYPDRHYYGGHCRRSK
jgi:glycine hydroxymethyltransferase